MAQQIAKVNSLKGWLKKTPRRTFVLYPGCIIAIELIIHRGSLVIVPWGIPFLLWGYLQYRLSGQYRTAHGGGGPGLDVPPSRVVDTGIYAYTRNPMYLGHLIFLSGLAITFWSVPALMLLLANIFWFNKRVLGDEAHMETRFGSKYLAYSGKVKRWIPWLL